VPEHAYAFHDVETLMSQGASDPGQTDPWEANAVLRPHRLWAVFHADLVRRHRSPRTIAAYRQTWFAFCQFIDPKPPLKANPKDLDRFLNRPSQGRGRQGGPVLSASSRSTYARQIRAIYRWLAAEELTRTDRMARHVPPPVPQPIPRALILADLAMLFDYLDSVEDPRIRIMGWLAYFAALRVGEIARLRIEDIHLRDDHPWMKIHGKGGRLRQVPIGPALADVLRPWLATRARTGPLLPDQRRPTRNISPKWVSHLLAVTMRDAGLEDTGHALRHSWATDALRAGKGRNLRAVSVVLGHSTTAVTERVYTSSYRADAVEAVRLTRDPRATN
jgi:integrase